MLKFFLHCFNLRFFSLKILCVFRSLHVIEILLPPGEVRGPLVVPGDLVLQDVQHLGPDLVGQDDRVELSEGGEAEENINDVSGEIYAGPPLLPEDPGQSSKQSLILRELLQIVRVT